jgi:F-type H+-transporting ATPase subunit delta
LGNGGAAIATTVKVAIPLSPDEIAGLQRSLEQYVGRPVTLDVEIDPEIIGGVWVRIGDAVIDGSLRARLESLRQHLCAQCRVILTTGIPAIETESRV